VASRQRNEFRFDRSAPGTAVVIAAVVLAKGSVLASRRDPIEALAYE
jgi:hypothetical protein